MIKSDNGVANTANDVKCRLRRIANSLTKEDALNTVNDFRNWDRFKGKLRNWLNSTAASEQVFTLP